MLKINLKGFEKTWVIAKKIGPTQCTNSDYTLDARSVLSSKPVDLGDILMRKVIFLSLETIIVKSHDRFLGNSFL